MGAGAWPALSESSATAYSAGTPTRSRRRSPSGTAAAGCQLVLDESRQSAPCVRGCAGGGGAALGPGEAGEWKRSGQALAKPRWGAKRSGRKVSGRRGGALGAHSGGAKQQTGVGGRASQEARRVQAASESHQAPTRDASIGRLEAYKAAVGGGQTHAAACTPAHTAGMWGRHASFAFAACLYRRLHRESARNAVQYAGDGVPDTDRTRTCTSLRRAVQE